MCIRDRLLITQESWPANGILKNSEVFGKYINPALKSKDRICLLYTSDAADERSSVDLGGRRIIKKKKQMYNGRHG